MLQANQSAPFGMSGFYHDSNGSFGHFPDFQARLQIQLPDHSHAQPKSQFSLTGFLSFLKTYSISWLSLRDLFIYSHLFRLRCGLRWSHHNLDSPLLSPYTVQ